MKQLVKFALSLIFGVSAFAISLASLFLLISPVVVLILIYISGGLLPENMPSLVGMAGKEEAHYIESYFSEYLTMTGREKFPIFLSLAVGGSVVLMKAVSIIILTYVFFICFYVVRTSNKWSEIILTAIGTIIVYIVIVGLWLILFENLIIPWIVFRGIFIVDGLEGILYFIALCFCLLIVGRGSILMLYQVPKVVALIYAIWNEEARVHFLRTLPKWLQPHVILRPMRGWSNNRSSRVTDSQARVDISGLNDPYSGASLVASRGLSQCQNCGSIYHQTSIAELQSQNSGRCINCEGSSFSTVRA